MNEIVKTKDIAEEDERHDGRMFSGMTTDEANGVPADCRKVQWESSSRRAHDANELLLDVCLRRCDRGRSDRAAYLCLCSSVWFSFPA